MIKKWISYLVPLVLGLALLNWVFNEIDLSKTLENFKSAKLSWVILGAFLALISHILRAARWGLMLESMGYKPSVYKTTLAILIGYLTNLVFPRAGEVARAVSLQKSTDIPFDKSFGAVIAERVTDVLVLLVLVGVNLLLEFDRIYALFVELVPDVSIVGVVAGLGIVGLLLLFLYRDRIKGTKLYQKFGGVFKGLKEGILSVVHLQNPWKFIGQSFLIWGLYYISSMVLCKAIGIGADLSPLAILTILVMGSIGMAIPTVGGIGSYHLLVGKIVTLYGLSQQDGVSLATFLHSLNGILFVLLFGFVALVLNTFAGQKR
jgi:uncharacterized protein (TIRG00374 family)